MPFTNSNQWHHLSTSARSHRMDRHRRQVWPIILPILVAVALVLGSASRGPATSPNSTISEIKIYSSVIGVSTRYIGACEGNVNFSRADLEDLGLNTYRVYGGMSRWEPEDDDGIYGLPTIAQIKANPDVIPWQVWDQVMTSPPQGSDYHFSGVPEELWQGNARSIFETLKQSHIRPVITIRNTDPGWSPDWALQLNPPRTEADWNEWWEHVFATVYWLNVRNDYRVDDFEIHNEPDNRQQGWGGNQQDYFELVRTGVDAIAYIYRTYLPDRQFHIHAPKTVGGSHWPADTLEAVPDYFDSVNVHNYDIDISNYIRQVRGWMRNTVHAQSPLWLGEWGTYTEGYSDLNFSLNLIQNMMRMSQPGDTYVYGNHLFSLYDWGYNNGFEGLIGKNGDRRLSYYAFRMGIRALQGGRSVLQITNNNSDLMAISTQDDDRKKINLLVLNSSSTDHIVNASFPVFGPRAKATIREFSERVLDELAEEVDFELNQITFQIPAYTSKLIVVSSYNTPDSF
ncbi:hypothetical protein IQ273_20495 [Nodosilinea sp. LEGE 07298]|uniref:hypothetical protein n=1 Tax=Nodosilinea sp. LEGE 07298 TaxID=2777970 RepID=UPI0018828D08|nr:hypothetical protein [Nodosilinea sp. LEGE 07298]MBE9111790.1 hypothetical protein [Nodosilinea sp. LEGE 07298]